MNGRTRSTRPIVLVLVLAAITAGCGITTTTVPGTGVSVAGARPLRDGPLEFVVLDTTRANRVGDLSNPGLSLTAKGEFVAVTLSIRNTGEAPVTFFDRHQVLVDGSGDLFSPSMAADIYANPGIRSTTIEPGGELTVHIVFDVPVGTVASSLRLRESSSSAGVTVPLT